MYQEEKLPRNIALWWNYPLLWFGSELPSMSWAEEGEVQVLEMDRAESTVQHKWFKEAIAETKGEKQPQ